MENKINLRNMYISKIQKQIAKLSSSTKLLDKLNINIIQTGGSENATANSVDKTIETIKDTLIHAINKKLNTIDTMQTNSRNKMLDIMKKKLANAGSKTNQNVDELQNIIKELKSQQETNRNNLENVNKEFIKTLMELMLNHSQTNIDNLIEIIKDIKNIYINEEKINDLGMPRDYIKKILDKFNSSNQIKGYSKGILNILDLMYKEVVDYKKTNDVNINDVNINDVNINEYIKDNIFTNEKYNDKMNEIENNLKIFDIDNDKTEYDTFYENYLSLELYKFDNDSLSHVEEELKYFNIEVDALHTVPDNS